MSEITINADLWNRLSLQEQGNVEAQLRTSNVLGAHDRVVGGDVSLPAEPGVTLATRGHHGEFAFFHGFSPLLWSSVTAQR